MINQNLDQLAANIHKKWESSQFEDRKFSQISFEELSAFELNLELPSFEKQVASRCLDSKDLPDQLNVYNTFGEPPFTIFNNGRFVLDIYFWMHVDTSIHSHAFSGAFKLLFGQSLHESFQIKNLEKYAQDVIKTQVKRTETKLLRPGETQEILAEELFHHRLIHLDAPTITLCARTVNDKKKKQWHHFSNGLSVQKQELSKTLVKKVYYFQYLHHQDKQYSKTFLQAFLKDLSLSELLNLYEQVYQESLPLEPGACETFLALFHHNYGETPWFALYQGFYEHAQQHFITYEEDSTPARFMEHVINNKYPFNEAKELLEELQGLPLSDEQLHALSDL